MKGFRTMLGVAVLFFAFQAPASARTLNVDLHVSGPLGDITNCTAEWFFQGFRWGPVPICFTPSEVYYGRALRLYRLLDVPTGSGYCYARLKVWRQGQWYPTVYEECVWLNPTSIGVVYYFRVWQQTAGREGTPDEPLRTDRNAQRNDVKGTAFRCIDGFGMEETLAIDSTIGRIVQTCGLSELQERELRNLLAEGLRAAVREHATDVTERMQRLAIGIERLMTVDQTIEFENWLQSHFLEEGVFQATAGR